ncbi:1-aminocyclopropane-1-carboxylate deaminase/D-cysteine desulfhydrase [Psychromonas aquatilis]|uniref:Pyridoxal-phosphate dependent enzyme n=1 Tax=Psychromonas aquatilis TaxID=2005072 RepID=A0ABU9GLB2_9GAMM
MKDLNKNLLKQLNPSPLQMITHPLLAKHKITLAVKRDDLLDPDISGNKWRKLKYNLLYAQKNNIHKLLSFGGAFSNHIHALAAASHRFNFDATGIIRGEAHYIKNPTLSKVQQWGMKLQFVDRKTYRLKEQTDYLQTLKVKFPNTYIIPEGGTNQLAIPGVEEVVEELITQSQPIDYLFTATGSAGTLAGLISGAIKYGAVMQIHGIAVLKNAHYLKQVVNDLVPQAETANWQLHETFHEGGYAKVSPELDRFCHQFSEQTNIPIEPIYTGKMFYAVWQLIQKGFFPAGSHIVLLHTGGLQGLAGLNERNEFIN